MNRLPYNEFSEQFTGDMPSMDYAYHNEQKNYKKLICCQCGLEFYRKKTEAVESDVCGKCIKTNFERITK